MKKSAVLYIKRFSASLTILFGCLMLSSCFDLVEQIDMDHGGSGAIKATLNLSKSRTKVAALLKMKQFNGIDIPSEATIKQEIEKAVQTLKSTSGISQVHYQLDFTNYIATLSCHFENVQALNNFSGTLSKQFKIPINSYNSYQYDQLAGTFTRSYTHAPDMAKAFAKIPNDDQQLFADAYYTNIIRFDKNIQLQSNKNAKLSANKQAVFLKVKATGLVNGLTDLTNTITLVK